MRGHNGVIIMPHWIAPLPITINASKFLNNLELFVMCSIRL